MGGNGLCILAAAASDVSYPRRLLANPRAEDAYVVVFSGASLRTRTPALLCGSGGCRSGFVDYLSSTRARKSCSGRLAFVSCLSDSDTQKTGGCGLGFVDYGSENTSPRRRRHVHLCKGHQSLSRAMCSHASSLSFKAFVGEDCGVGFVNHGSENASHCGPLCKGRQFLSRAMCSPSRNLNFQSVGDKDGCRLALHGMLVMNVIGLSKFARRVRTKASSNTSEPMPVSGLAIPSKVKTQVEKVLEGLGSFWNRLVHPLSNFGFGKRSVSEAGVGLFVLSGIVLFFITLAWVRNFQLRTSRKYKATFEFSKAWGITVGTSVRIRGVDVGSVVAVRPSLERLDVQVQIADARVVIPRNALVEVNQSGLVSETLIDITPRFPLPQPTVGPLDPGCSAEGLIVCHRDRIKGEQGVSLDELVGICTKLARQMDDQGLEKLFEATERISLAVEEAKPLLAKAESMAADIAPLLKDMQEGGFAQDLNRLIRVAAEVGQDLSKLNTAILTPENMELLRQSVSTLTRTLKHVENISGDISLLTGDAGTQYNLKQLIQSLSRLITD